MISKRNSIGVELCPEFFVGFWFRCENKEHNYIVFLVYKLSQKIICMEERIEFKNSRGQKLVGLLARPNAKVYTRFQQGIDCPLAIYCHGYGTDKNRKKGNVLARKLPARGIALFRFDFSGSGESDGEIGDITASRLLDDLRAAYNIVINQPGIDQAKVAFVGSSFGGLVSLLGMTEGPNILPTKTSVFISPATDYKENHRKPSAADYRSNEFYIDIWKRDVFGLARNIRQPCLVIHGSIDDVCFLSGSEKLVGSLPMGSRLEVIRGEGHLYENEDNFNRMMTLTVDWLKEKLTAF
jgi:dipeptidyl aminopeptidase/acylaminoacyl peptidase